MTSCRATCPTTTPTTKPADIVVTPQRLPCHLPAVPAPIKIVGHPGPDPTFDSIYVSKSDMVELLGYVVALQSFVKQAAICIEGR